MTVRQFAQQIEWLLLAGALEGNRVLVLHQQLQCYQQGAISATALIAASMR